MHRTFTNDCRESNSIAAYKIEARKIYVGSYEHELPHGRLMQFYVDTGSSCLFFMDNLKNIIYKRVIFINYEHYLINLLIGQN